MQCFMVGTGSDERRTALAARAQDLGFPPAMSPSLALLRSDRRFLDATMPLILLSDTAMDPLDVPAAIEFAREQTGRGFVVCVADAMASDAYKRLVRTGSAEWLTWGDLHDELRDLVARLTAAASSDRAAAVLSFVPSKGGVGTTTLLIETAVQLSVRRKRSGARIAILDLNLQGGTVADALDIEPRFAVNEIVDRPERLDEQLVDIFTSRYSKTLDVFASPMSRLSPEAVKSDIVFAFIDAIASRYDAILFDLPAQWLPWTDSLLRGSDAVVVCGGESVPALRRLAATLNHLDGLAIADSKVAAVVNAAETGLFGRVARKTVIERALARRRTFFVRRDGASAGKALDVGRPLQEIVPNSAVVRDVRRIGSWLETIVDRVPAVQVKPTLRRGAAA